MMESGAFGRQLAAAFRLADAPVLQTRTARDGILALTDIRVDPEVPFRSATLQAEDAYLICLCLTDYPKLQLWEDGRQSTIEHVSAGQILIHDLRRNPLRLVDKPFRSLNFYLPREVLDDIADLSDAPRIGDLERSAGVAISDPTIATLMHTINGGFEQPGAVGRLFVDHISLALATHIAQAYGGLKPHSRAVRGGLAPWQEKKVKEMVSAKLATVLTVGDLARECNLSHRHFCRAFRHTMGISPHAYLQTARIDKAKTLLAGTSMKLTDIASACGFADQSHFTRVFTQFAGLTPGVWRRSAVTETRVE